MKQAITDFDLFFLSYDEPRKEEFWANLQDLVPWAKRVDGIKGFDSAHKECANQSETDRFITVDGDTLMRPAFLDLTLDIPPRLEHSTLSWNSYNVINGLYYGNGGLKLWTKDFVLGMCTHENATRAEERVDFCWDERYVQLLNVYSDTYPNGSPFQAFRAGFREGVKLTLNRGAKIVDQAMIKDNVYSENYKRLLIWASVGANVENGLWSIYGTRLGMYQAYIDKTFDISKISDYDWFKSYFYEEIAPRFKGDESEKCSRTNLRWDPNVVIGESSKLLIPLRNELDIKLADLDEHQSAFFMSAYPRLKVSDNPLMTESGAL